MAHNVSRSRQLDRAEDEARAELMRHLVPGWTVTLHPPFRIQAIATIMGAHLRGTELLMRCQRSDCGRRVQPELEGLVRGGFGHLSPAELCDHLSCRHPLGCRLTRPIETYPLGVPLVAYVSQPDHLIAVTCQGCRHTVSRTAVDTIARLKAAGRGDGSTGVNDLSGRVRGPCRKCGGQAFSVELVRPCAPGAGPPV